MAGLEVIADPDTPHAAGTDLDPSQHQLVRHSLGPVCRVLQRVGQDRLLDWRWNAVRVWPLRARQPIDESVGAVLKGPPDLVELLVAITHDPARLRDVAEFLGKL